MEHQGGLQLGSSQLSRSRLVAGLLWTILVVMLLVLVANRSYLGTAQPVWPTVLLAALVGSGLVLLKRGHLNLAVGIANSCLFVAATVPVWRFGLEAASNSLMLYFIPLALAGLVLNRTRLLVTAAGTVLVVLISLFLQYSGLLRPVGGNGLSTGSLLLAGQFLVVFLILTVIVDRFGQTTALALAQSNQRALELEAEASVRRQVQLELADERNFSAAVIDSLPGVFFVMDHNRRILRGNPNIEEASGYSRAEVDNMTLSDFVAAEDLPLLEVRLQEVAFEGGANANLNLMNKHGRAIPYHFKAARFSMKDEPYIVVLGYDLSEVTEARFHVERLNNALRDRVDRLTALRQIDSAMTQGLGAQATMQVLLRQVTERLKVDAAAMLRFDRQTTRLVWQNGIGFRGRGLEVSNLGLGEGLPGRAAMTRRSIYVHGADELADSYVRMPLISDEGFQFYLAVPLVADDELEGVLEIFHRNDFRPSSDWTDFLEALATQAALALNHARMVEHLEQSNAELRQAYGTTIEGWSRALDLRDEETVGHSKRVTELTVELARRMGASEERLVHIRRGALLHDIGKMGVPDRILLKPGALTESERQEMERHTTYAFELLQPIEFLQPALGIPYCHHENWDGSGYPQGLRGEDIPLAARVFTVVDVYDALTNDRPYRRAWDDERARAYICEQSGSKFDPKVVDEFMALLSERDHQPAG